MRACYAAGTRACQNNGLIRTHPCTTTKQKQDPSFKLRLKSGITMVSENGVKVRVERDTEYATMKVE